MSDIVKLIIKIPKEDYKRITKYQNVSGCENMLTNSIINAIPLDDVKAEIKAKKVVETDIVKLFYNMALNDVNEILADIDNTESEE